MNFLQRRDSLPYLRRTQLMRNTTEHVDIFSLGGCFFTFTNSRMEPVILRVKISKALFVLRNDRPQGLLEDNLSLDAITPMLFEGRNIILTMFGNVDRIFHMDTIELPSYDDILAILHGFDNNPYCIHVLRVYDNFVVISFTPEGSKYIVDNFNAIQLYVNLEIVWRNDIYRYGIPKSIQDNFCIRRERSIELTLGNPLFYCGIQKIPPTICSIAEASNLIFGIFDDKLHYYHSVREREECMRCTPDRAFADTQIGLTLSRHRQMINELDKIIAGLGGPLSPSPSRLFISDHDSASDDDFLVGVEENPGMIFSKPLYESERIIAPIYDFDLRPNMFSNPFSGVGESVNRFSEVFSEGLKIPDLLSGIESFKEVAKDLGQTFKEGTKVDVTHKMDFSYIADKFKGILPTNFIDEIFISLGVENPFVKNAIVILIISVIYIGVMSRNPSPLVKIFMYVLILTVSIKSESPEVSSFCKTLVGCDILATVIDYIMNMNIKEEEGEEEELESNSASFTPDNSIKTFVSGVLFLYLGKSARFDIDDILSKCVAFQKLANGTVFTVQTFVDGFTSLINLITGKFGFKLFRDTYSAFPVIYFITDEFHRLKTDTDGSKRIVKSQYDEFLRLCQVLNDTEKLIPNTTEYSVYRQQISYLRSVQKILDLAFRMQGLSSTFLRREPYCFILLGQPGCGKTVLLNSFVDNIMPFLLEESQYDLYTDNKSAFVSSVKPESKYQEGLGSGTVFIKVDDFLQMKNKNADPEICHGNWLIKVKNIEPEVVPKAFANKGQVYYDPDLIGLSTNVLSINDVATQLSVSDIGAVTRRFDSAWQVDIKEEYKLYSADKTAWKVDFSKIKGISTDHYIMRGYSYEVNHVGAHVLPTAKYDVSLNYLDWVRFMVKDILQHQNRSELELETIMNSSKLPSMNPFFGMSKLEAMKSIDDFSFKAENKSGVVYPASKIGKSFSLKGNMYATKRVDPMLLLEDMFSFWDPEFYEILYRSDPEYYQFMQENIVEVFEWWKAKLGDEFAVPATFFNWIFFPASKEAYAFVETFKMTYRLIRTSCRRFKITLKMIFKMSTRVPFKQFMVNSATIIKSALMAQMRDSWTYLKDLYWNTFFVQGFWAREMTIGVLSTVVLVLGKLLSSEALQPNSMLKIKLSGKTRKSNTTKKNTTFKLSTGNNTTVDMEGNSRKLDENAINLSKKVVMSNLYSLEILDNPLTEMMFIAGTTALINTHSAVIIGMALHKDPNTFLHIRDKRGKRFSFRADSCEIFQFPEIDIASITFSSKVLLPKPDIRKYFGTNSLIKSMDTNVDMTMVYSYLEKGDSVVIYYPVSTWRDFARYAEDGRTYEYKAFFYSIEGRVGTCMSPLWLTDSKYPGSNLIMGLHSAGNTHKSHGPKGASTIMTQEILDEILKVSGFLEPSIIVPVPEFLSVNCRVPAKFQICGTTTKIPMAEYSKYKKTPLYGFHGPPVKVPCVLQDYSVDVNGVTVNHEPYVKALNKYGYDCPMINTDIMDISYSMYMKTWTQAKAKYNVTPRVRTIEEAVNGFNSISPDARTSSTGYDLRLRGITKNMLYGAEGDRDVTSPCFLELKAELMSVLDLMYKGIVPDYKYLNFGKSELLPIEKVEDGKLRLIAGEGTVALLIGKMLFGDLVDCATQCSIFNGMCTGVNPYSTDWDVMGKILEVYKYIFDGDQSSYDGRFQQWLYCYFSRFCRSHYLGAPEHEHLARDTYLYRMCMALHVIHIDGEAYVVLIEGVLPSGDFLTQMLGNFVNHLCSRATYVISWVESIGSSYFTYSLYHCEKPNISDLSDNFWVFSLGDDNVISCKTEKYDYHAITAQRNFALIGFKYTSAAKSDEIDYKWRALELITFLKRYWVFSRRFGRYIAPIDKTSIIYGLYFSESNFREGHAAINTMLQEMSLWGRDAWRDFVAKLVAEAARKGYTLPGEFLDYEVCIMFITNCNTPQWCDDSGEGWAVFLAREQLERIADCGDSALESESLSNRPPINTLTMTTYDLKPNMNAPVSMEEHITTVFVDEGEVDSNPMSVVPTDSHERESSDIKDFLAKPVLVSAIQWGVASTLSTTLFNQTIGPDLLSNVKWAAKLEGWNMIRAKACFRFMINAQPFQQGMLYAHFVPNYVDRGSPPNLMNLTTPRVASWSQHPGIEMTAGTSAAEIKIPYIAPTRYFSLDGTGISWGSLFLSVYSRLDDGTGSATADISVYQWWEDVELSAPMTTNSFKSSSISDKEARIMASTGSVSSALRAVGKAANALTSIPFITDYAKTTAWAADNLAGLASHFGYSKPVSEDSNLTSARQLMRYGATSDGSNTAFPLALRSDNKLKTLTDLSIRGEDEMSFNFLKQVPFCYDQANWTVLTAVGGTLLSTYIAPSAIYNSYTITSGGHGNTFRIFPPFGYLAKAFSLWRGTIRMRLKFIKTQFHTGRVEILWQPTINTVTTPLDTESQFCLREIVDIRYADEITLDLPWMLPYDYANISDFSGKVTVRVLNQLRAPSTCCDTIQMLTWFSGGPDFELEGPIYGGAGSGGVPFLGGNSLPSSSLGLTPAPNLSIVPAESSVGEHFNSVKQLLLRNSPLYSYQGVTITNGCYRVWPWFVSGAGTNVGVITKPLFGGDTFSFISPMYGFYRGSVNITDVRYTALGKKAWLSYLASGAPVDPGTDLITQFIDFSDPAVTPSYGLGAVIADEGPGYATFNVPYYNTNRMSFVTIIAANSIPAFATDPAVALTVSTSLTTTPGLFRSVGDDYQLSYFINTPPLLVIHT